MPKYVSRERKYCIAALKKLAKDKRIGGPTRLAAIDRIAVLDRLYDVELSRPQERPEKVPMPEPVPVAEPTQDDAEEKALLDQFYKQHYGGESGTIISVPADPNATATVTIATEITGSNSQCQQGGC